MSFAAALERLNAQGLELAPSPDPAAPRRKFDLDHMRILARALGDPQFKFPSVLIAGTNGKGSTAATLASILAAGGYRTGLYTSPHLTRVTERIRTAAPAAPFADIPEADFARLYFQVDETARSLVASAQLPHHPSFFETLTALAFLFFAEQNLDIAILEVGLGGRLDATNIVEPLLSVITDVALDHQEYLGHSLSAIAREKAGILRPGGILVTLPQHPEANQAIGEAAVALNVTGINAASYLPNRETATCSSVRHSDPTLDSARHSDPILGQNLRISPVTTSIRDRRTVVDGNSPNRYQINLDGELLNIASPLAGEHQRRNIALAIAAAIALRNLNSYNIVEVSPTRNINSYNIPNSAILRGIAATSWPGRLELLAPNLLLDVAHNPAGAWTLRAALASIPDAQPRTLIFSCLADKDLREMAQIVFPLFDPTGGRPHDHIILTQIDSPRAVSLDALAATARSLDTPFHLARHAAEALALARSLTPPGGLIVATGSVYLVGELRTLALAPSPPVRAK